MKIKLVYPRRRRLSGRATGTAYFNLRWSSGSVTKRDVQFGSLASAIKFLKHRLKEIPLSERDSLFAELFAEVRKPTGGLGRFSLGTCIGETSLSGLFQRAEAAWNQLEREHDHQKLKVASTIDLKH